MENLSSEIVQEVLTRLSKPKSRTDIESVLQCRKVCTLWRSLLRKPETGMLFCSNLANNSGIQLYYEDLEKLWEMALQISCNERPQNLFNMVTRIDSLDGKNINLVGSCNGLVCYEAYDDGICVFNPITGERIRILDPGENYVECINLRLYKQDVVGFGYCNSTNAYKVIRIRDLGLYKQGVQVYTLGDGRGWRDIEGIFYFTRYAVEGSGVFANGALHWLNCRSDCDIIAFDLKDETFQILPSPPTCNIPSRFDNKIDIGSFGGNLCLCLCYKEHGEPMMDIWIFQKEKMNNCQLGTEDSLTWINVFSRKCVVGYEKKCQLLYLAESEILLWQNNILCCCDRKAAISKVLWYTGSDVQAIPHRNSLVSLKDLGEELVDSSDVG